MAKTVAEIAAIIHADMCDDDDNGYSWSPREGGDSPKGVKTLVIDGREYSYPRGSWDCSSSVIKAWREAIKYTKYRGKLDGAATTHNMRSVFKASGLFEVWDTQSTEAVRGDIYLRDQEHTAMCQDGGKDGVYGYDALSEFCINENGEVYGGRVGDQTGTEAYIHGFYGTWDCTLHYNGKADGTSSESTKRTNTATVAKSRLNGIDIASHQGMIDVSKVDADFVIVKVSGGTSYVNDKAHGADQNWRDVANKVLKSGKLLGLYHYACEYDSEPGGKAEAEYFLKQIKGFEGKAVLCLDWEAHAQSMPVSYAKEWLDTVAKATGSTPMFYGYASYLNSRDHSAIKKYPLWMASYLNRYEWGSGYVDNPNNTWDTGSWPKMTMYQYASTRTISGYSGRLDVNVFYGTRADWLALAGGKVNSEKASQDDAKSASKTSAKVSANPAKYRVSTDPDGMDWYAEMQDLVDTGADGDDYAGSFGEPITFIACNAKKYRVFTKDNGWLPWVKKYDVGDLDKGCAGDGSAILGVEVKDGDIVYAAHVSSGWYADMKGSKQVDGRSTDHFAGDLANEIDAIRMRRA